VSEARDEPAGTQPRGDRLALAFEILEIVAQRRTGISANELARTLGLHRATVYRAVNWLVQQEFLLRKSDLSGFLLGVRVVELAKVISVVDSAENRLIAELRRETGAAIHLARFVNERIELANEDPEHPISDPVAFGAHPERSAVGQVLLAELPAARAQRVAHLGRDEIEELGAAAEARGFAQQIGLLSADRACLAVPVRAEDGACGGAIALSTAPSRISTAARHVTALREAARELSGIWAGSEARQLR
jgi:DNA-binding IclR family transcriptional regulator